MEYMKRKHARSGASPLTCRSILNIGRILAERRVALMLHCCVRGVERDIGLHTLLDAPSQFLELWIALLAENANSLSHYVRMAQAGNCFKTVVSYQQEIRRGGRSVGKEVYHKSAQLWEMKVCECESLKVGGAVTYHGSPANPLYLIYRQMSAHGGLSLPPAIPSRRSHCQDSPVIMIGLPVPPVCLMRIAFSSDAHRFKIRCASL